MSIRWTCLALFAFAPLALAAGPVRETLGPVTFTLPGSWARSVDAGGTVSYTPDAASGSAGSQISFSTVDGTGSEADVHRVVWGELKKNVGGTSAEATGKAGRFLWSEGKFIEPASKQEVAMRFYSTKEVGSHIYVVLMAFPAQLRTRAVELERILANAKWATAKLPAASAAAPPPNDVPIVGAHIQMEMRFGAFAGSSNYTIDHILFFGNGIAVRTGVINGAIECYAAMPVTNLTTLPFNYGRWRQNAATKGIDVEWKDGGVWNLKPDGSLLSLKGKRLSKLHPLEGARFNGVYVYRPVGDPPTAIALTPDGRFEAQNLREGMICNPGRNPVTAGRGRYEVRKWTLILRFDGGGTLMLPLHVMNDVNLANVTQFWVRSHDFDLVR
jgi:hypothetical protein